MIRIRHIVAAAGLALSLGSSNALAWGCDGHQAVVMLAEKLLSPAAIAKMRSVLAESPVDSAIKPYCTPVADDPIADAATWADDSRTLDPSTAGWHFINLPIAPKASVKDYKTYCPNGSCVIEAIVSQYRILTTAGTGALARGDALRYLLHFLGDLHQPLHSSTDGDRGGNCMPVTFDNQTPREDESHNFKPNLHSVWDDGMIRQLMRTEHLSDARALADYAIRDTRLRTSRGQAPTTALVAGWAREANGLARTVAYGKLPAAVPMEPANVISLASCDSNNHVGSRMAALNEQITDGYERAGVPVILGQLRVAAERLASILTAAFPG